MITAGTSVSSPRGRELWIVLAFALAASASSLWNGFALDDVPIVAGNPRVHDLAGITQLFAQPYWPAEFGSSLYRPLMMVLFTVQWAIGGGSAFVFHLVSVSLYVALSLAVLRLGREVLDDRTAFLAAMVFAVHPVHVEAFANVVGQAELIVALIVLETVRHYLHSRRTGALSLRKSLVISLAFLAALFVKEHAIVLPLLLLLVEVLLVRGEGMRRDARKVAVLASGLAVVAIVFLALRTSVLGRFAGGSTATVLAGQDFPARFFTMLNVMPEWLRLFFFPATLSADYSPPRIETATSFAFSMLPMILVLVSTAAIAVRAWRVKPALSFSIAFCAATLLIPSNLVIITGFALAERALLLASVGVAFLLGMAGTAVLAAARTPDVRKLATAVGLLLLGAALLRSHTRGPVWKDNETLFRQTVRDVPTSYRAHLMLGELLTDKGTTREGLDELELAVRLSRRGDYFVRWFAADRFHAAGMLEEAVRYYEQALRIKPGDARALKGEAAARASLAAQRRISGIDS